MRCALIMKYLLVQYAVVRQVGGNDAVRRQAVAILFF
jgi:hypothetical protein